MCGVFDEELDKRFLEAVRIENEIKKIKGLPIAKYDFERKAPYLEYPDGKREYCSVECKRKWEKTHYKTYQHKCNYCGKIFESQSKKQKFCSKKCYNKYRFYREKDVVELAECLKKGEGPRFIPSWIRNLICGEL